MIQTLSSFIQFINQTWLSFFNINFPGLSSITFFDVAFFLFFIFGISFVIKRILGK